jgi:Cys-tRNA(Pro)/Cys-tRNA(Cys) deacylase
MAATRAIAAAERAGIAFRTLAYEHDPKAESYGLEAAEKLGLDPARAFKTLVVEVDGQLGVAIVPVGTQVDPKALGGKRAAMADRAVAERATGYVVGGISPLGQRRRLATTLDVSALWHETIFVSAGRRALEIELDPRDLVRLTDADVRPIARF